MNKHIAQLLYSKDCVIIPDFGGFITQTKAAEFVDEANTAYPLRKTVAFNEELKENDGLLAHFIAQELGIAYEEAQARVREKTAALKAELQAKGNVLFQPLGTLYYTKEENILFVADGNANFHKDSYGLPKLKLRKLQNTVVTPPAIPEPVVQEVEKVETPTQETKAKVERSEKRLVKQERVRTAKRKRPIALNIVNALGSIFLLAIMSALLNFELNYEGLHPMVSQPAQLIDTPMDSAEPYAAYQNVKSLLAEYEQNTELSYYSILLDGTFSKDAVENIQSEISLKFMQSEIIELENNEYTISVISFMNENLAKEYRDLIQKTIEYELIITAK